MVISPHSKIVVTGGLGFIGSCLIRHLIAKTGAQVLNVDKVTYVSSTAALEDAKSSSRHEFVKLDLVNPHAITELITEFEPTAVIHLAAQTHVDNSIQSPADFIHSNVVGTQNLLEASRAYWNTLGANEKKSFRLLHVSTDEVFGDLADDSPGFTEASHYQPSSPYSASKASADHLVRAWFRTFGLPTLVTNCSNNYGPYQFPEKLIPLMINHGLERKRLPVYGNGRQKRDWLFVEDHVRALVAVLQRGRVGETYNIGGMSETTNLDVVSTICATLDEIRPQREFRHRELIEFVTDRPGHDHRYAIDCSKIQKELGWTPDIEFHDGLRRTIEWNVEHQDWCNEMAARKPEKSHWLQT